ncbi:hypothetical protein Y032_0032g2476 [Ancylostoma ceylanicum]|uniref:Uncharacterized protein n=1 Tax=Ancylostoma ceylanicum TaxID=53326 RepID=A0A016UNJ2_9BILA|nr:hypothetical protein Y032_0032g2476 [Ancylostoma ceylanicum]
MSSASFFEVSSTWTTIKVPGRKILWPIYSFVISEAYRAQLELLGPASCFHSVDCFCAKSSWKTRSDHPQSERVEHMMASTYG